jgi:hypothetical protein
MILEAISLINKALSSLDISTKYLNRGYTILSVFPTLYILRIIYGLQQNGNYVQMVLYLIAFLVFLYFIVLNVLYYFFDKNVKADITQLFVKVLPDDVFNIVENDKKNKHHHAQIDLADAQEVAVAYHEDYQLKLANYMRSFIKEGHIKTNDVTNHDGFVVTPNTLYPYYFVKQLSAHRYSLQIGATYDDLEEIGTIATHAGEGKLRPIGLFIVGGDFVKDGFRYHEPYRLKLVAKKEEAKTNQTTQTRSRSAISEPAAYTQPVTHTQDATPTQTRSRSRRNRR